MTSAEIESPIGPDERNLFQQVVGEDIPRRYVRVLDADVAADRQAALILLLLNPGGSASDWLSFCEARDRRWEELVLTEAGGVATNWAAGRWAAYASGRSPVGAVSVTVRHEGRVRRRPIVEGFFVAAFWSPVGAPDNELLGLPEVLDFTT